MALTKVTGQGVGTVDEVLIQKASSGATATSNTVLTVEDDDNTELSLLGGSSSLLALNFGHSGDADDGIINYNTTAGAEAFTFKVDGGKEALYLSAGDVVINNGSLDMNFRVEGNGEANLLFVDAGNDKIGIGTSTPSETLTVTGNFNATTGVKSLGVYNNTTGTGANVVVDSGGGFARSTSSRRYKNTIEDATHGLKELLALRSVTYKGNNDGDILSGGLIAEEVHDAGLTEFVTYNDKKEPDALAYGNMVSLCIKAIQELSAKNDALEASIAELKGNK